MGEWVFTLESEDNARWGKSSQVQTQFGPVARAYRDPLDGRPNPRVSVTWNIAGDGTIEAAKAFHAALGKAIEIAEGYERELDNE